MELKNKIALAGIAALGFAAPAFAQSASGVVNLVSINGSGASQTYSYNIVLKNTGTTSIDSFWFAWIPYSGQLPDNYYNFLPSDPSAEVSPTGWSPTVVGPGVFGDGYSIRWDASSDPLAAGSTDDYGFTTKDDFATITGPDTIAFIPTPVGTSYIYTGAPEASPEAEVTIAAGSDVVPEPATLGLLATAAVGIFARRPRRVQA
jgi:hypothetical protein